MNTKNNYQTKAKSQEETDDENDFPIRTYGKGELAAKYMPDVQQQTAVNRFNEWIHLCPGLEERLAATGWSLERRKYTPAQVRIIVPPRHFRFRFKRFTGNAQAICQQLQAVFLQLQHISPVPYPRVRKYARERYFYLYREKSH